MKKVIRLNESDLERIVLRVIKESEKGSNLMGFILNKLVDSGLVLLSNVNIVEDGFEVHTMEGEYFDYFTDNFIKFEQSGDNDVILNFVKYEEEEDTEQAIEVLEWLYPKLDEIFGDKITFMDNLDID